MGMRRICAWVCGMFMTMTAWGQMPPLPVPEDEGAKPKWVSPVEKKRIEPTATMKKAEKNRDRSPYNWVSAGPQGATDGQVEGMGAQNNPVAGAIHCVLPHPENADILWIGSVNGGIWKTENARAASPVWTPLTDEAAGLSIAALEMDPTDTSHQTLIAGLGRVSSLGRISGPLSGCLYSTDGGESWANIGKDNLEGESLSGVAIRGSVIVCTGNSFFASGAGGVFRSVDGGATFSLLSGATGTGVPEGAAFYLAADPANPQNLYTGIKEEGVFFSSDTGATWTNISGLDFGTGEDILDYTTNNIEIAVHHHSGNGTQAVYVGVINFGQLAGLYRTEDNGLNWQEMDLPVTNEGGDLIGLQPRGKSGAQGFIHFSILADPVNPYMVYVGGDRQPAGKDPETGDSTWPNSIGANNYTGRLFRCDASQPSGSQFQPITHVNTASNSAPHADSRDMNFDAEGKLIQGDDGGIYKHTNPSQNSGDWFSINGNLATAETHSVAWDANSDIFMAGTQDIGTIYQPYTDAAIWLSQAQGDGGVVAIDTMSRAAQNQSVRYRYYYYLLGMTRTVFDDLNNIVSNEEPALIVSGTGGEILDEVDSEVGFYQEILLNRVNHGRAVTASRWVYETSDGFDLLTTFTAKTTSTVAALDYGGHFDGNDYEDVLYFADSFNVCLRENMGGPVSHFPFPGYYGLEDMIMDRLDWKRVFLVNSDSVWELQTPAGDWTDLTGNLGDYFAMDATIPLRTINMLYNASGRKTLVVGGPGKVVASFRDAPGEWFAVGDATLPNAMMMDLRYYPEADMLLVGTLGRGAWVLENASAQLDPRTAAQAHWRGLQ